MSSAWERMRLYCTSSLISTDHVVWFDHTPFFSRVSIEALSDHPSELKSHLLRLMELYILSFALVFGALSGTLTELDDAENNLEAIIFVTCAVLNIASFSGAGMALAVYNVISATSDKNLPALMRANHNLIPTVKFTWLLCIYAWVVIIGAILFTKVWDFLGEDAVWIAIIVYSGIVLCLLYVMGYALNIFARMALYSGVLGSRKAPTIFDDNAISSEADAVRAMATLVCTRKSFTEEDVLRLYRAATAREFKISAPQKVQGQGANRAHQGVFHNEVQRGVTEVKVRMRSAIEMKSVEENLESASVSQNQDGSSVQGRGSRARSKAATVVAAG